MVPSTTAVAEKDPYLRIARPIEVQLEEVARALKCAPHCQSVTEELRKIVEFGLSRFGASASNAREFADALNFAPNDCRRVVSDVPVVHNTWLHLSKSIVLPQAREFLLGASVCVEGEGDIRKTLDYLSSIKSEMALCSPLRQGLDREMAKKLTDMGNSIYDKPEVSYDHRQAWIIARRQLKIGAEVGVSATLINPVERAMINTASVRLCNPPTYNERLSDLRKILLNKEQKPSDELLKGDNLIWRFSEKLGYWGPAMPGSAKTNSTLFNLSVIGLDEAERKSRSSSIFNSWSARKVDLIDDLKKDQKYKNDLPTLFEEQSKTLLKYLDQRARNE